MTQRDAPPEPCSGSPSLREDVRAPSHRRLLAALAALAALGAVAGCDGAAPQDAATPDAGARDGGRGDAGPRFDAGPAELSLTVVTFNSGTTPSLDHDGGPDDGYGAAEAAVSDAHYGDGLAWRSAVEATRRFFDDLDPDVVVFQEIFHSGECASIAPEHHAGFVCETWTEGDPTVAQRVLGPDYQVACHLGKPDKCAAVHRRLGTFRGCDADLCLDGLDGALVPGCGSGSRVGRGVIELVGGGTLTVVNVHGTSGITEEEAACRVRQFEQVFVDLDGAAAADGEANLVLGDLNTDPYRLADADPSAARFLDFAGRLGEGRPFHFLSARGRRAEPTYAGLLDIDHAVTDHFVGACRAPGIDGPPVYEGVYFDHAPIVCDIAGPRPR